MEGRTTDIYVSRKNKTGITTTRTVREKKVKKKKKEKKKKKGLKGNKKEKKMVLDTYFWVPEKKGQQH